MFGIDDAITKMGNKIITGLKIAASAIGARIMAAFGLTWVNMHYVLPDVKAWLADKFVGLPPLALEFIAACGFDVFMTLIISAICARTGFRVFIAATAALESYMQGAGA